LGWAPAEGEEVLTREELVVRFDLDRVTQSAAAFDHQKLDWMNGEWIRRSSIPALVGAIQPFVRDRFGPVDETRLGEVVRIGQERATTLVALVDQAAFLFVE